ncbi:MAG TPA: hybrid sensor histidine kinase/response regulator [Terriglobales bacterium]|jgi:chemosensory pili system protein ChpA (sensor histidine kinase/response regulator)|nr:hybrid sensor histidine kinase/response regulator [Terriglobales bacterium]
MNPPPSPTHAEPAETFLHHASKHLQFLREYSGLLQDPYPVPEDIERLFVSAQTLKENSARGGYPLFSEIGGKLAQIFHYAMNTSISADVSGPLVEFISEAVALLESDLQMIGAGRAEGTEDINAFRQKYPFAFAQQPGAPSMSLSKGSPVPATWQQIVATAFSAPVTQVQFAIPDLPPDGEIPQEVLEFFIPEAEEHLQVVTECLLSLEANPQANEDIHRLFRAIHTVKGAAAQVGWRRIAHVAHRAEDLVGRVRDGLLRPSVEIVDICLESVDVLKKILYKQWPDETTLQLSVKLLLLRIANLAPEQPEEVETQAATPAKIRTAAPQGKAEPAKKSATASAKTAPAKAVAGPRIVSPPLALPAPLARPVIASAAKKEDDAEMRILPADHHSEPTALPQSKSVRISLERLDQMLNAVGELVINRTRMRGRLAELEQLSAALNFSRERISEKISELHEKYEFGKPALPLMSQPAGGSLTHAGTERAAAWKTGISDAIGLKEPFLHSRAPEFSELERGDELSVFSHSLSEISSDIAEVLTQVDRLARRMDTDVDDFTKLTRRLQDEITRARMVPIGNLYTRLSRAARDAAKASGKQVELSLFGAETELDNNIIQQISDPLIHLVRNAVAHGIERGEDRYHAGKSEVGKVAVRAYPRGNHIFIEVEDDGHGIDFERVRSTAVQAALVSAEEADKLGERELLELLFAPGFSTASQQTELAGRGVGLDVVRTNLNALNAEVEIDTQKLLGTRFTLKVPLTLIISQALFVRCSGSTFAFPLALVEEIRRLKTSELEEAEGRLFTQVRDLAVEVVRLDALLQLEPVEPVNGYYRLVMVNVSGRQVGVIVEDVIRQDEIVVKNLGDYLRNVRLFPGATIAPDGTLILLVDLNRLLMGESFARRPLMAHTHPNETRIFAPEVAAAAQSSIPAAAIDAVPEEKVIVLADDSISVRKFVGRMLEKAGYRVKFASDGLEALEIVNRSICDLLITDLEMPRTNGYELLALLREQPEIHRVPVVVVTSRAGARFREQALKEGASAFLLKPVQEEQLLAVVNELIGAKADKSKAAAAGTGVNIAHVVNQLAKNLVNERSPQNPATNG